MKCNPIGKNVNLLINIYLDTIVKIGNKINLSYIIYETLC